MRTRVAGYDGIEIEYQLPAPARVRAILHDAVGRPAPSSSGDSRDRNDNPVRSGVYFIRLDAPGFRAVERAVVMS